MTRSLLTFLLLLLSVVTLKAQKPQVANILGNQKVMSQVKIVMDHINGFEFDAADREQRVLQKMVPDHPIAYLLDGLADYWQFYPVYAHEDRAKAYREKLFACQKRAEHMLDQDDESIEGTFFLMMTDMMLAKHYNDRKESLTALNYIRRSYGKIVKGFDLKNKFVEFYFTTGLYDFFREAIPENNPGMKSLMWMFPSGSKERGLQELEHAFNKSVFTRPDAAVFLNKIYLYFENKPAKAAYYIGIISKEFPENPYYMLGYAEALLANKEYDKALPVIEKLVARPEPLYNGTGTIMLGWYHELGSKDLAASGKNYVSGLEKLKKEKGNLVDNLKGVAYTGLARAWHKAGNRQTAKSYYQKAEKLLTYKDLKKEAKAYQD